MGRLDGKVAVITGAAGGIGREAAVLFSEEGASVVVADVGSSAGADAAAACRSATFIEVDVSNPESVQALYAKAVETYGGVDILYNNAGIMPRRRRLDPHHRGRRVRSRPVGQREGRVSLLQVRHPSPARPWRRFGDQRRVVRRAGRCGDVADRVHGVEGSRPLDESRARGAVRAAGGSRQCALPGTGGDAAADASVLGQPRRVRAATDPSPDGPARDRARDRECGAVPREQRVAHTSTARRSSSTVASLRRT